ncbi:hypothetical protein F5984_12580 [Rudanella paleaurantiibacter]|uniref:Uncharacterized protein n=1 Tax=Rudanella paleaurantiibacter TaxID=2614655 RepID=A0A7J5TY75_9BACT|nr:hypothetical protein [Rudanella paleaurantiibacter]KAB7730015.1 hypothetical protein F5984_12580 [Rudanella paleaurantiibacter]
MLVLIGIAILGAVAYYTSAWFGCQSSGMGPLPPHYAPPARDATLPTREDPDGSILEPDEQPVY